MLSMPPATTRSASPAFIAWAANIPAFRPDPQTLLRVVAQTVSGRPAKMAAWRGGARPRPGAPHVPHEHFIDGGRIVQAGPADCLAHYGRAELHRAERRQRALKAPHGSPDGAQDDRQPGVEVLRHRRPL